MAHVVGKPHIDLRPEGASRIQMLTAQENIMLRIALALRTRQVFVHLILEATLNWEVLRRSLWYLVSASQGCPRGPSTADDHTSSIAISNGMSLPTSRGLHYLCQPSPWPPPPIWDVCIYFSHGSASRHRITT